MYKDKYKNISTGINYKPIRPDSILLYIYPYCVTLLLTLSKIYFSALELGSINYT